LKYFDSCQLGTTFICAGKVADVFLFCDSFKGNK